jgi:ABC-type antimicrobial peptide transport system permease subunit
MNEFVDNSERFDMNITVSSPVNDALLQFEYIKLFLDSTLLTIVFFILILSAMLIYSLMVSDIDEKTYEMGMLRALGLRSRSLLQIILMQSTIFSVSGVI